MVQVSPPAGEPLWPDGVMDRRTRTDNIPIEAEVEGKPSDQFWLQPIVTEWTNPHDPFAPGQSIEVRLRCRHCDWGYNSNAGFVTITNMRRMSEDGERHQLVCTRAGRNLPLESAEIVNDIPTEGDKR